MKKRRLVQDFLGSRIWYDETPLAFSLMDGAAFARVCTFGDCMFGWQVVLSPTDNSIRVGFATIEAARDSLRKALEARLDEMDAAPPRADAFNRLS